jgi:hypothetical protein
MSGLFETIHRCMFERMSICAFFGTALRDGRNIKLWRICKLNWRSNGVHRWRSSGDIGNPQKSTYRNRNNAASWWWHGFLHSRRYNIAIIGAHWYSLKYEMWPSHWSIHRAESIGGPGPELEIETMGALRRKPTIKLQRTEAYIFRWPKMVVYQMISEVQRYEAL